MTKTGTFSRYGVAVVILSLLLGAMVLQPVAQEPALSDKVLAAQLEAVILEEVETEAGIQTTVEIPIAKDTYIASNKPNQNFGGARELRVGYNLNGDGALRSFFQFDVDRYIPDQAIIDSALLYIYEYSYTPSGDGAMDVLGRHLLTPWDEYQVTWNSHQPDWGAITGYASVPASLGWQSHDVTALVKEWQNDTHANYGIIVIGDENVQERQRTFYSLNANNGNYPRLVVEYTLFVDTTPPVATVNPLPTWSPTTFTVTWGGYDPGGSGIAYYDIQYSINYGPWMNWKEHQTGTEAAFTGGINGSVYQFRARAVDKVGNVQPWGAAQAQTRVDTIPPVATVNPLPDYTLTQQFYVTWGGTDNSGGSGIARYDVQYRVNGGMWEQWLIGTTNTAVLFTGAQDDGLYEFRARAIDGAGNVQPWSDNPQAQTYVDTTGPVSIVKPFYPAKTSDSSFTVQWSALSLPGASIQYFDVRYRFRDGPWIQWLTGTQLTSVLFDQLNTNDGAYLFQARAMDSNGRLGAWSEPGATMYVDRNPPFMTPVAYMPIVSR
ncbi:MAG: DNRLRE domain-containing protein [Anaerolineae bacterium]